jgi:ferric-dicitrate binding protein FerR (iron transport regulator)
VTRQTAREVDDEAAAWALKSGVGDRQSAPDPELQAWLSGDPRRRGALLRAQAALSFVDRARALAEAPPAGAPIRPSPSRRRVLALAGAGGLAAAGIGAMAVLGGGRRYATQIGEIRRAALQDGSLAEINTNSVLDVAMRLRSRDVVLRKGEAWFQVAKDRARPFVVAAGDIRVQAVGTAFSVRRKSAGAEVRALAEKIGAPVVAFRTGKGVLDARHPLALGTVAGFHLWDDTDLVIGIGTRLDVPMSRWAPAPSGLKTARIDIDAAEHRRLPVTVPIVADAVDGTRALLAAVSANDDPARRARVAAA